ncbi:MAG: radical SAM protein [Candidatus Vogelbacteria bacterium]|nr:radical SAM protein [Candidatus Vogelbacteria bacterium]
MDTRRNVLLVQVNYQYGNNVFVPYSVGSIQAYAENIPEIENNFKFQEPVFLREDPLEVIKKTSEPMVVGFSCYLWNWEYNKILAEAIKTTFPRCLVVFGGPQVPDKSEGFFFACPYVDILVHHEGEFSFSEILLESLSLQPDYTKIPGLSVRVLGDESFKTSARSRILDLSKLPSPYLSGVFDFLLGRSFALSACQETNRGCPYRCQFCDWGGNTFDKLVPMNESRLLAEFEWFGINRVEYVFNCDSNYGILPRDVDLTRKMIEVRAQYGEYPRKFRMCTAKNSNDKVFAITKMLNDAAMNKGATLSFQSMDINTLSIVKRENIKIEKFQELMQRYRKAGIATYTELIMGLPGETYESSKKGISTLIDAQEDSLNLYVYLCTVLPNSGLNEPFYVKSYGIKSVRSPILLAHSTPSADSVVEYNNMIIETASMPEKDWKRTCLFYLAVQCFHCLGLTKHIAILFRRQFGISYGDFYEKLVIYFSGREDSLIGEQLAQVSKVIERAVDGDRLDLVIPKFGDIYWPLEEATFLNIITNKQKFYEEIRSFVSELSQGLGQDNKGELIDDLILYQSSVIIDPIVSELGIELRYNFLEYFGDSVDRNMELKSSPVRLLIEADQNFSGDLERYAREVVWYGRKGGRFHHGNITKET